jgi:hypothetical protein
MEGNDVHYIFYSFHMLPLVLRFQVVVKDW